MDYAKIKDGVVINVISLRKAQSAEFPDIVPLNDIPAGIGDTFSDGVFYRDGEEVKSIAKMLSEANADTESVFAILQGEVE